MKRISTILLILLLIAFGASALAANADGQGDLIARNAELAAFMDDNGKIYVSGVASPINSTKASSIVSIDPYRIVFFAAASDDSLVPESRLMSLSLSDFSETAITDDAAAACVYEDTIFFISKAGPTQLKKYNLDTKKTTTAFSAFETIQSLYACKDGVVIAMVDNSGAYLYNNDFGTATPYNEVIASEIGVFDEFEVLLTDAQALMVKEAGASSAKTVDTSVKSWAVIDDTIYYISGFSGNLSLRSYNVSNALWDNIMLLPADMNQQLTASRRTLFLLSNTSYTVYTLDMSVKTLKTFATLPSLSSYALGNGKVLTGYRIEAVSGQLNIYGELAASNAGEMFNFVDFAGQAVRTKQNYILLSAYSIKEEDTVLTLLQPAKQYTTLRRGSRGEAVSAIQKPLEEKGYYDYYIDGIFGWRTERAIELLQADLGLTVNGVADANLQKIILSGNFSAYDPYRTLSRGDRGLRVQEMQQRLRDLGYLADDADAIYGPRTQKAVALFQAENGLRETGTADSSMLKKLFADSANVCSSYIDLQYGDSGYRVRELNERLKALYYLEGKVGSTYNSATRAAVIRFQQETGLKQTGTATEAVQQKLFSKYAPEYSDYISLQRGDDNARVKNLQRRLKELGYYSDSIDGYFGKNTLSAVKKFQRAVGLTANGIADPETQRALYADDAPEYKESADLGLPVIDLSSYSKYENGLYQISDADTIGGSINATWYAEGEIAGFDMTLKDDRGAIYMQHFGLRLDQNIISIPISTLSEERTYTLSVTANPNPAYDGAPTSSSIQFIRVTKAPDPEPEEIGKIGKLIISPVGSDIIRESGVYLIPGETLSFIWSADGSVSGYIYRVTDGDNVLYSNSNIDGTMELNIPASALSEDSSYTLTVSAVPTNGTIDDATTESISFKPYTAPVATPEPVVTPEPAVETPEPEATPEPAVETPEPEATPEPVVSPAVNTPELAMVPYGRIVEKSFAVNGESVTANVYEISEESFRLTWSSGDTASYYDVTISDGNGSAIVDQQTTDGSIELFASDLAFDEIYTLNVTAHCATDESKTANVRLYFMLPQQEVMQIAADENKEIVPVSLGTPVISFDPFIGSTLDENGAECILIGESNVLLISWNAEGNVAGYDILIVDAYGNEKSALYTASANATLDTAYLEPNEMYTLYVTAYAAEDNSVTSSASANFMLPADEPEVVPEEPEYVPEEPEATAEPIVIGNPQLAFDPISEMTADGIALIPETTELTIYWHAEGNIGGYQIRIMDSYGSEIAALDSATDYSTLSTDYLTCEDIYTVSVTAFAAEDAGVTGYAEARFMIPASEPEYVPEEPEYEPEYVPEEPEYEPEVVPEPVTIGETSLMIQPCLSTEVFENGDVLYSLNPTGEIEFAWYADGNIGSYTMCIWDENHGEAIELFTLNLSDTTLKLSAEQLLEAGLEYDSVYRIQVTAIAAEDANVTSSATAELIIVSPETLS